MLLAGLSCALADAVSARASAANAATIALSVVLLFLFVLLHFFLAAETRLFPRNGPLFLFPMFYSALPRSLTTAAATE